MTIKDLDNCITYYVNPEKRTVVAKLNLFVSPQIFDCKILQEVPQRNYISRVWGAFDNFFIYTCYDNYCKRFGTESDYYTCVGQAYCDPVDTFEVEFGKRLAREKCLSKYYDMLLRVYADTADALFELSNIASDIELNVYRKRKNMLNNIKLYTFTR